MELNKDLEIISYLAQRNYYLPKGFTGYKDNVCPFSEEIAINDIKSHLKHAFRNNHQENYLTEINNLAKQNHQNFKVVITPHSPTYRKKLKEFALEFNYNYDDIFMPLFKVAKENGIEILDYFDNAKFSDDDFADYEHLLPTGAIKLTNLIIKEGLNEFERNLQSIQS